MGESQCPLCGHIVTGFEQHEFDLNQAANAAKEVEREKLVAALVKFVGHFGPLEDNHMLHEEARKCFWLARAALGPEIYDAAIKAALSN